MRRLRLAFGFFTVLPLSRSGSMEEIAGAGFWLPLVAVFLGGAEGLLGWGASGIFGVFVAAALMLAAALLLSGLHHADGLADVGDAIMAGGNHARRLAVLKDRTMGVGALAALMLTFIITWAGLAEALAGLNPALWPWMLVSVEVSARLALVTLSLLARPSHRGSGSAFISGFRGWRGAAAVLMSIALLAALMRPLGFWPPAACGSAAIGAGALLAIGGRRWFGGANGDLLGAAVELGRMAAVLAAATALAVTL